LGSDGVVLLHEAAIWLGRALSCRVSTGAEEGNGGQSPPAAHLNGCGTGAALVEEDELAEEGDNGCLELCEPLHCQLQQATYKFSCRFI
jgi:hypothetical protein